MELLKELVIEALKSERAEIVFPNISIDLADLAELKSYGALSEIKEIVSNDSLGDFDCVEKIVRVLEKYGSNGGNRHDF